MMPYLRLIPSTHTFYSYLLLIAPYLQLIAPYLQHIAPKVASDKRDHILHTDIIPREILLKCSGSTFLVKGKGDMASSYQRTYNCVFVCVCVHVFACACMYDLVCMSQ